MITLIVLGVACIQFKNAFVFQDIIIEVQNNPVQDHQDIEFRMVGYKKYECASTRVYGVAYHEDGSHSHNLNIFTKQYVRNVHTGETIPNSFHMEVPEDMHPGKYYVSMTGEFQCNFLIFQETKSQTYDNIPLVVM